jgi:hypothetical protein
MRGNIIRKCCSGERSCRPENTISGIGIGKMLAGLFFLLSDHVPVRIGPLENMLDAA